MNKKEILAKAQKEGQAGIDEGTKHSKNQALLYGRIGVDAVFCVIALTGLFTSTPIPTEAYAMFFAGLCGDLYAQWRNEGKPIYLILAMISLVAIVVNLALTVCRMVGLAW